MLRHPSQLCCEGHHSMLRFFNHSAALILGEREVLPMFGQRPIAQSGANCSTDNKENEKMQLSDSRRMVDDIGTRGMKKGGCPMGDRLFED